MQEPLIETVAGTKHQTMLPETNGPLISISGQMPNDENSHANVPEDSGRYLAEARTLNAWSPSVETAFSTLAYARPKVATP
jgi:hypothetical protein